MSLPADFDLKEQVRAAVDIVDVMGQSLELRPQGRNFVALCPFHNDKRPSLTVNPVRQTWKCWPCDKGGDVFSFIQLRDGVSFPEALRILAERAGIEMPKFGGKRVEPGSPEDKATLLAAMKFACQAFYDRLEKDPSPETKAAREYLASRGIDDDSRQRFQIGYAPDDFKWLLNQTSAAGFKPEVVEAAGLALRKESHRAPYDRFRGRLMFPIFDLQDRPISAGGRILPSDDPAKSSGAKYINGPETLLFSKSHQLYGLNLARAAIMQSREVLVMEGYTDVIAARQAGIEPVVAVLGTALGEGHIRIIKRFADRVVLVLDGDAAGRRRADEVLELFIREDVDLRVLTLPEGSDPADYIQSAGRDAFEQLVSDAPDAIEHKLSSLLEGVDLLTDTHRATAAIETMLAIVAKAPQHAGDLRTDQILLRLSRVFGTAKDGLAARLKQIRIEQSKRRRYSASKPASKQNVAPKPPAKPMPANFDPNMALMESSEDADFDASAGKMPVTHAPTMVAERAPRWEAITGIDRELFEILIEDPELAPVAIETINPQTLQTDSARGIFTAYQELDLAGRSLDVQSLLLVVEEEALRNMIVTMDERVQRRVGQLTASPEERYNDLQQRFQQRQWNAQRQKHLAALDAASVSDDEATKLLQDLFDGEKARKGLLNRTPAGQANPSPGSPSPGN